MTREPQHINDIRPYPLHWPGNQPRTAPMDRHGARRWHADWNTATRDLAFELEKALVHDWQISSNHRVNGRAAATDDPGVAVWFMKPRVDGFILSVIACDSFDRMAQNIKAIAMTLQRLRQIEDYGCYSFDKAMRGAAYTALPAPEAPPRNWWEILGVDPDIDPDALKAVHKALVKKYHPDNANGGDPTKFREIQEAFERATA